MTNAERIDALQKDIITKKCQLIVGHIDDLCEMLHEYDIEIDLQDVLAYSLEDLKHTLATDMQDRLV